MSSGFLPNIFVMTFSVNGIKQEKEEKHAVDILVCVDSLMLARNILEHHNILILSIHDYGEEHKAFWDIYFTINLNFEDIDIVTKFTDIQKACDFFAFVGFDITKINRYSSPISPLKMAEIIAQSKAEVEKRKVEDKLLLEKGKAKQKKIYADQKLDQAKEFLAKVFERVDATVKRSVGQIPIMDMNKIKYMIEELKKLRMGTNVETIRDTVEDLFTILERINATRYESQKAKAIAIDGDSIITDLDIQQEAEKLEYTQILKSIHANIPLRNQEYKIFGAAAVYLKLIQREFWHKMENTSGLFYVLYDITEFVVLILVTLIGITTIINQIYIVTTAEPGLAYSLVTIGIRGLVIFFARLRRTKNIGRLILLIGLAILAHYLLMRMVASNFAI